MNTFVEGGVTIALAVVGLAMLSVLVSRNAATAQDIQAGASGFGNVLGVAMSPVTGANPNINLGYPGSGGYGSTFGF